MNILGKPKDKQEMIQEIERLKILAQQYLKQIIKNRESIGNMLNEAENTDNEPRKQELIIRADRAIQFNNKFLKALKDTENQIELSKKSLSDAPGLYIKQSLPTTKITKTTRKGGKYKKSKISKKSKKVKKSKPKKSKKVKMSKPKSKKHLKVKN